MVLRENDYIISIWHKGGTITGITTLDQSEPGSNGKLQNWSLTIR